MIRAWLMRAHPPPERFPEPGFDLFEVWKQYEELSKHFNDLLMRLRSQSLAAVATFATAASVLLKPDAVGSDFRWGSLLAVFTFLTGFWLAIWLLDFLYYNRLLLGTVAALKAIEKQSEGGKNRISEIGLSTLIGTFVEHPKQTEQRVSKGLRWFYVVVMILLLSATAVSLGKFLTTKPGTQVELAGLVISSVTPDAIMLAEGKGIRVVKVGQTTEVTVNGRKATAAELQPGMAVNVVLIPEPSNATRVEATGK